MDGQKVEIRSTVTELLLPVAVFLNVQAFTIADWPDVPRYLLLFALVFGIIAILALIVRLTERAVGRATRVIVVMTGLQTITTILAWMISLILSLELRLEIIHAILAQIFSSIYFGLKLNEFWKRQHHRSDNLGSLDLARQLILLVIANITFMCLSGFLFTYLEGWEFLDSIYFIAVVVTTIGFGDFAPRTTYGKAALPFIAFFGMVILGLLIFAVRTIVIESMLNDVAESFEKSIESSSISPTSPVNNHRGNGPIIPNDASVVNIPGGLKREDEDAPLLSNRSSVLSLSSSSVTRSPSELSIPQIPTTNGVKFQRPRSASLPASAFNRQFSIQETGLNPPMVGNFLFETTRKLSLHHHQQPQLNMGLTTSPLLFQKISEKRLRYHLFISLSLSFILLFVFGALFATLEGWTIWEGMYFASISYTTIGLGDYYVATKAGKSCFLYFVIFGVISLSWSGSLLAERASGWWKSRVSEIRERAVVRGRSKGWYEEIGRDED